MNKQWSDKNKQMQSLMKKATFSDGISQLIELRDILAAEMNSWRMALSDEDYSKTPFPNADSYHNKTIAYSIWHIARIEDIVVNTLIKNRDEMLFDGFVERTNSPIITTGNELVKEQIAEFSSKLDINGLYDYMRAVKDNR